MSKQVRTFSYPYPVLSPNTDDHPDTVTHQKCSYAMTVPSKVEEYNKGEWQVPIIHRLVCAELQNAVDEKRAGFAVLAVQRTALKRKTFQSSVSDHSINLPASEFSNEGQITLSPFVVSLTDETWTLSDHYHPEYQLLTARSFTPGYGGRIAEGHPIKIAPPEDRPQSIIDVMEATFKFADDDMFAVDLSSDRIQIQLQPSLHSSVQILMGSRHEEVLKSALYLPALVEAITNLEQHQELRWAETIQNALDKCSGLPSPASQHALTCAQALLGYPMKDTIQHLTDANEAYETGFDAEWNAVVYDG